MKQFILLTLSLLALSPISLVALGNAKIVINGKMRDKERAKNSMRREAKRAKRHQAWLAARQQNPDNLIPVMTNEQIDQVKSYGRSNVHMYVAHMDALAKAVNS